MTNKINMTDSSTPLMSHSCDDVQRINIIDRTPVFKGFWEVDYKLSQYMILSMMIATLKNVAEEYPGKTIENIIAQMEARRKELINN